MGRGSRPGGRAARAAGAAAARARLHEQRLKVERQQVGHDVGDAVPPGVGGIDRFERKVVDVPLRRVGPAVVLQRVMPLLRAQLRHGGAVAGRRRHRSAVQVLPEEVKVPALGGLGKRRHAAVAAEHAHAWRARRGAARRVSAVRARPRRAARRCSQEIPQQDQGAALNRPNNRRAHVAHRGGRGRTEAHDNVADRVAAGPGARPARPAGRRDENMENPGGGDPSRRLRPVAAGRYWTRRRRCACARERGAGGSHVPDQPTRGCGACTGACRAQATTRPPLGAHSA